MRAAERAWPKSGYISMPDAPVPLSLAVTNGNDHTPLVPHELPSLAETNGKDDTPLVPNQASSLATKPNLLNGSAPVDDDKPTQNGHAKSDNRLPAALAPLVALPHWVIWRWKKP